MAAVCRACMQARQRCVPSASEGAGGWAHLNHCRRPASATGSSSGFVRKPSRRGGYGPTRPKGAGGGISACPVKGCSDYGVWEGKHLALIAAVGPRNSFQIPETAASAPAGPTPVSRQDAGGGVPARRGRDCWRNFTPGMQAQPCKVPHGTGGLTRRLHAEWFPFCSVWRFFAHLSERQNKIESE